MAEGSAVLAATAATGSGRVTAVLEERRLLGSQSPRIEVVPDGDEHPRWPEVLEMLDALGIVLDEWQLRVLWVSLLRAGKMWAAAVVAVCCPRQNGKNAIIEARELVGALILQEELILHTAHLADTSGAAFQRMKDLIDENAWLDSRVAHVWSANGKERVEFTNGCSIRFRTRTRGGGRGLSGSPLMFDEAMFLPEVALSSIRFVSSAKPDPQAWYTGSAVDQLVHEDGFVFARQRARALSGDAARLAYFEWSLPYDTPDDVPEDVLRDPEAAALTNPAFGVRISVENFQAELDELTLRALAVERHGVGDWPTVDGSAVTVIPVDSWAALADPRSSLGGAVCLAYDVSPDRAWASIAAAGERPDGLGHVEIVDRRRGTGWVSARLAELVAAHETTGVVCDGSGPAGSLLSEIEQAGVVVTPVTGHEHAKGCGMIFDAVEQKTIRHLGTPEMLAAIKGAGTRPLGDAWAWSRKSSGVDISPLVACTLAYWGFQAAPAADTWRAY